MIDPRPEENGSATFSSLRVPTFRLFWWSGVYSYLGVQMQFLLRGLLAWDLTERESGLGVVYLAFGMGLLIFTPIGGVLADRWPKRSLLVFGQGIIAIAAAGMGLAAVSGNARFWMLMVASLVQGAMFGLIGPARVSTSAELVGREQLGNAISLTSMSMSLTRLFAPAAAGVLAGVATIGIGGAYLVAAVFSVVSTLLTARLPRLEPSNPSQQNPLDEIRDGLRYVRSKPELGRLILTTTIAIMVGFNYVAFLPALVEGQMGLSESHVGFLTTASAAGAVLVTAFVASRADGPNAQMLLICCGIAFGIGVIGFGLAPNYLAALLIIVILGFATNGFMVLTSSRSMVISDDSYHGRVQSLMQLAWAGFGIAAAPLGAAAEIIGLRLTIVIMGLATVVVVGLYALSLLSSVVRTTE
ncbi:MAG: MFS transporter [Actinomycetota bacterium]|nr:MFS transporter [Actinomycetota bacterium]MED5293530.1 MFS transporter [Actinomycetota bacterium]MEE3256828.1 MFS transporter [Actinomycetota bacterium]